jgi:hypothetical protein
MLEILALIAFGAAAVIAGLARAWAVALISVGLFLVTLPVNLKL